MLKKFNKIFKTPLTNRKKCCRIVLNRLNNNRYPKERGDFMGNKVKEYREKKNMTQVDLSRKSGVSRVTISQIERGVERNTSTRTLLKLARALDTTVEKIFFANDV